jgi:hypothetical protein
MKISETNYGGDWRDRLLNSWPFLLDTDTIRTAAWAWDNEGIYRPGTRSLYYNGFIFLRLSLPFGVFVHLKPLRNLRIQAGLGWKLNGRFAMTFRFQSDESAFDGERGDNYGQAAGWDRGTA